MSNTKTYNIKGMHCASCANIIEKTLKKMDGVHSVEVNYGTERAKLSFDEEKTNHHHLSKQIEPLGYSLVAPTAESMGMSENEHAGHLGLNQSKQEKMVELKSMRNKVISVIPIAIISVFIMSWDILAQFSLITGLSFFIIYFQYWLLTHYLLLVNLTCLASIVFLDTEKPTWIH